MDSFNPTAPASGKIRPSLTELQSEDFFNQLQLESEKLRNHQAFSYNDAGADSASNLNTKSIFPEPTRTNSKKSRFARQREAELQKQSGHHDSDFSIDPPVPTGRFQLDLTEDEEDCLDQIPHTSCSPEPPNKSMLGSIIEHDLIRGSPNNDFVSNYQPAGFPQAQFCPPTIPNSVSKPTDYKSVGSTIPPWELKRLPRGPSQSDPKSKPEDPLFSAEVKSQIASENRTLLSRMTQAEILREQEGLKAQLAGSNPQLLARLLSKSSMTSPSSSHNLVNDSPKVDGCDTVDPSKKQVRWSEAAQPNETDFSVDPTTLINCGISPEGVLDNSIEASSSTTVQSIAFDFHGNIVSNQNCGDQNCHAVDNDDLGLHTHQASGFTLKKLLRMSLSAVPAQRAIAFKVMTQIVAKHHTAVDHGQQRDHLVRDIDANVLDMLITASQAVRDKNMGVVTSAITLACLILINAQLLQKGSILDRARFKNEWIEHLLTQTAILSDLNRHLISPSLPKTSLVLIVKIFHGFIQLGDTIKVSEEITRTSGLLEAVIQTLVAVSWPPTTPTGFEIPDVNSIGLFELLAKASRTCSRSILDRGLLTPSLRFIALPYWHLIATCDKPEEKVQLKLDDNTITSLAAFMQCQLRILTTFAAYGLGTSLRTTWDSLLRQTTAWLRECLVQAIQRIASSSSQRAAQEIDLVAAYLNLLTSWTQCADDPHVLDPPHSINWTQVTDWKSEAFDFLHASLSAEQTVDCYVAASVITSSCDLIVAILVGSLKKRLDSSDVITGLIKLQPQLDTCLQTAVQNLCLMSRRPDNLDLDEYLRYSRLIISLARLTYHVSPRVPSGSSHNFLSINLNMTVDSPDSVFMHACRTAFKYEQVSSLPWALSVLEQSPTQAFQPVKMTLSSLLLRNSDGTTVNLSLESLLRHFQSQVDTSIANASGANSTRPSSLVDLLAVYDDYISQSGSMSAIVYSCPRQIQTQMSQSDPPAFLLSSTWPLLALNFLTSDHVGRLSGAGNSSAEVYHWIFAMAVSVQLTLQKAQNRFPSLSDVFDRLVLNRHSVWKNLLTSIIFQSSLIPDQPTPSQTNQLPPPIFQDSVTANLINQLVSSFKLSTHEPSSDNPPSLVNKPLANTHDLLKIEESELYTILSDILGIFDSSSFGNQTFSMLLIPFFSMTHSEDFRTLILKDYSQILPHLKTNFEEVLILEEHSQGLFSYFYPMENKEFLLDIYCQLMSDKSSIDHQDQPFLFQYMLHHVSSQIWNPKCEDRLRIKLLLKVLKTGTNEVCQHVLNYNQPDGVEEGLIKPEVPSKCFELGKTSKLYQERVEWLQRHMNEVQDLEHLNELDWSLGMPI